MEGRRRVAQSKPEALLLVNFWNSFSAKLKPILANFKGPIIVYQPVGATHQLPPEFLRTAPRADYIHSIENWDALERGLRAVHGMTRMAQSRLLRVASQFKQQEDTTEPFFGTAIRGVPADQLNDLFDETRLCRDMERLAKSVRSQARHVTDLSDAAFKDGPVPCRRPADHAAARRRGDLRRAYRAMQELSAARKRVDITTLSDALGDRSGEIGDRICASRT